MNRTLTALFLAAASSPAFGQAFNIDVGDNLLYPVPSPSYGAAAGQPGVWNAVGGLTPVSGTLVDVNGVTTSVSYSGVGGISYEWNNTHTFGDDQKLMDDANDPGLGGQWTFSGLAPGVYRVYTYAWAPDNTTFRASVNVAGSPDPQQVEGGPWPSGGLTQGVTHAVHRVILAPGQSLVVNIGVVVQFGTLNGLQIVPELDSFASFCHPGVGAYPACPCANPPAGAGRGCDNSSSTGGATLAGSGSALVAGDTLVLTTADERPTAFSIVLQGTSVSAGSQFGQGLRCVAGNLKRLYTKNASAGSIVAPGPGDASVSARSSALGDAIAAGSHRYYLVYYRDPVVLGACASNLTFNATQSLDVLWQ